MWYRQRPKARDRVVLRAHNDGEKNGARIKSISPTVSDLR